MSYYWIRVGAGVVVLGVFALGALIVAASWMPKLASIPIAIFLSFGAWQIARVFAPRTLIAD